MAILMHNDVGWVKSATAATLDDTPGVLVKAGETLLYGWSIANTVAAITYVQLFNAVQLSDVILGTTVPDAWIALSASSTGTAALTRPIHFTLGLCAFSTTAPTGASASISHATFFYA